MNASGRLNTCKSRGSVGVAILPTATGARVSNAYATFPRQGDSPGKLGLIPRKPRDGIVLRLKFRRSGVGMRAIRQLVG